ncbi:MAG: 4-hydroxy-tetrahydrodipicolinate reductase [Polyangiaceae bacterium]
MAAIRLAVVGASGRMGEAVLRLARASTEFEVVCEISEGNDFSAIERAKPHVAVDFSRPSGTRVLADIASRASIALVIGTTGLDAASDHALGEAAKKAPVLVASNMSIGAHALGVLAERAAKMLEDFDIEIVEAHHKRKIDAPSGTALTLAQIVREARTPSASIVHGREGHVGARKPNEIGMHAVRGGDVVGDHTVFFFGEGERIELSHKASNRDLFARGALRAAKWVVTKSPGIYGMRDMLGGA